MSREVHQRVVGPRGGPGKRDKPSVRERERVFSALKGPPEEDEEDYSCARRYTLYL